jgi:tetratricopeptide (TPR) repeat protein
MAKNSSRDAKLSRNERRNLDVEISFVEGVVRRDPQFVEALRILGDDYTRRGRFVDGLKVDEQLIQLRPDDALAHYNLGCSYALTDCFAQAAEALERAILLGYNDFKWLMRDPDLKTFRKHPLFAPIRKHIKSVQVKIR